MTWFADIRARLSGIYLTRRSAAALAAPVPVVALVPGWLAWLIAIAWLVLIAIVVRRDIALAPGDAELEVERIMPAKFSIGVVNATALAIRNRSGQPARLIGRETPPSGFAGERAFGPIEIAAHSSGRQDLSFTPPARGAYRFGAVGVRSLGPLGLAGRQLAFALTQECHVYPDITAVYGYSLLARKGALHEIGVRATRYAGVGSEFESLRDYLAGDDYRDIDWKATARRGAPVVRQFEAERSQTVVLAIDAGRLMNVRVSGLPKLDRSINAALLLAYLAVQAGDNVGLFVFGREVRRYLPPRKGHRQFLAILEALYSVEGRVEEPDYGAALRYLASRLSKRSLVVLFTELVGTEPSRRLLGVLGSLSPRHLPLVVTQRNLDVEALAGTVPANAGEAYQAAVAQDLVHDKAAALRVLESRGSLVLDVVPEKLSVAAVNRYLEIKARGRL